MLELQWTHDRDVVYMELGGWVYSLCVCFL